MGSNQGTTSNTNNECFEQQKYNSWKNKESRHHYSDERYVLMPFSNQIKWKEISSSLNNLSLELRNQNRNLDLNLIEKTIMSYNRNFKNWNFGVLREYFRLLDPLGEAQIIRYLLLKMIDLVLESENLFPEKIPYLKRGENNSVSLTDKQCATILANGFFCTFSDRLNINNKYLSNINFNRYIIILSFNSKIYFNYFHT